MTSCSQPANDSPTSLALEIDVQTALALSRATTRAISAISPHARQEMIEALKREVRIQHTQGGPVVELVAALIEGHAADIA